MSKSNSIMLLSMVALTPLFLISCKLVSYETIYTEQTRIISAEMTLDDYPAEDVVIVFDSPYTFEGPAREWSLPTGIYSPFLEDDNGGVYYRSPSAMVGGGPWEGGLLFKNGDSRQAYVYFIDGSSPISLIQSFRMPEDFSPRIIERSRLSR